MKIVRFDMPSRSTRDGEEASGGGNSAMVPASMTASVMHNKVVVISIVEKTLINLSVLSKVEVGEKLGWTSSGHFVIQPPSYWTIANRLLNRIDRWTTLQKIQDVINTAESMMAVSEGRRISTSLKKSIHGIRNIQTTYGDDVLMYSSLNVLLDRLADRFNLTESDLL